MLKVPLCLSVCRYRSSDLCSRDESYSGLINHSPRVSVCAEITLHWVVSGRCCRWSTERSSTSSSQRVEGCSSASVSANMLTLGHCRDHDSRTWSFVSVPKICLSLTSVNIWKCFWLHFATFELLLAAVHQFLVCYCAGLVFIESSWVITHRRTGKLTSVVVSNVGCSAPASHLWLTDTRT